VNLKEKQGVEIIKSLIKNCDVLVENYVPNKMDEFGLSYEKAKEINPRLIYCSISGFGDKGKYKMKPGFDLIASALYGMLSITGEENSKVPVKSGVALTDICTGLFATQGI
jgi:succinate--hydroxymethylglutarate CoA-transferase